MIAFLVINRKANKMKFPMNKIIRKNLVQILFFIILFFTHCHNTTAQNNLVPKIVPPSPEAASLGKFVEVPVSYYTGLPNISVPLYTIESGEIKLPIQVSYHARGIQVSEIASQVGIGWALNAGGVITRQIRGKADESNNGYLVENFYNTFFTSEQTRKSVYDLSTSGVDPDNLIDMEPDVYFFNFLSFSGKFIFDQKTKLPVVQKFSDFKIVPIYEENAGYAIKGWIITDKDGIKYYFGTSKDELRKAIDRPQSTSSFVFLSQGGLQNPSNSSPYNNAWQLMDIVTPTNKHIKFEYVKDQPNYFTKNFDDGPAAALNAHFSRIIMDQYHIKAIYFDKGKVIFTKLPTQREDLRNSFALQKVEVYGVDNALKVKHSFNYSYTSSEETNSLYYLRTTEPQAKKRMFLESIVSEGAIATNKGKKYSFVYNSQILPNRFSTSQDNWGYYNGKDNGEFSSFFEGDDRRVDINKSEAGMLTKIIYPTGGSATFVYEHNKVKTPNFYKEILINPSTPENFKVVSLFKSDSSYVNGVYIKPFTIVGADPKKKVQIDSKITFFGDNAGSCSSSSNNALCPFEVAVYKANPVVGVGALYVGENKRSLMLEPGEYVLEVKPKTLAGHDPTNIENDSFTVKLNWEEPVSDENTILFAAGKRIKRIIWDDNLGGINSITSKTYKYSDSLGNSTGKTFSIPNMYYIMGTTANGTPVVNQIGATAGSPLTNFQGNALGYSFVTEFNGEEDNNIGKTEYTFTMPEDTGDYYKFPYHSPTDNEWLRGMPLFTKYYSHNLGGYSLVKEVVNKYVYGEVSLFPIYFTEMIDPDLPYLYLNHRRKFSFPLAIFTKDESLSGFEAYQNPNSYKIFYATGGTVDLASTEETETLKGSNKYKKTTKYFYNYDSNYQLKRSQTKSSNKEILETKYFYATDSEMANEPFRNELIAKYMIGVPLDTQTFNNDVKISEQKTVYDNSLKTSNLLLPRFIYSNKGAAGFDETDKKITFDQYDDKGNILQYTPEGGLPVSIIWGYNKTQPIAKVENATYDQIESYVANLQSKSDADNDNCATSSCKEQILRTALNTFRTSFAQGMVSTYTYNPLIGVTSVTDPKGMTSYYEYDSFGRLKFVRDKDLNVLQKYCYNYKGEQTDCSDNTSIGVLYESAAINGSFTKNDCGTGSGSVVSFSLASGAVTSLVSQADADGQALLQFNSEGQSNANANGICSFQSVALSSSFQKSNCSAGGIGSYIVYSLPVGAVTLNTSQSDVDAQAWTKLQIEGLANANSNGDCSFQSAALSGSFQKSNCSAGGIGSSIVYSLPVGAVTSNTSQADVDGKAWAKFQTEGLANANAYGDCSFQSAALSGTFQKNNCSVGGVGSYLSYSLPIGAVTSNTSQADVDAQAWSKFQNEGLANANAYGDCTFQSAALSGAFQKNNCSIGGIGSAVNYSLPVGAVTSNTSQAEVDGQAWTKFQNEGLANANAHGDCTFQSAALSGAFQKNNCSIGGIGSTVNYSLPVGAVTSNTSQAEVDGQAWAKFQNEGLANANANGDCTFQSAALSGSFQKNNCSVGGVGSYLSYSLPVGTITLKTSQADVDTQAWNRFQNEGQYNVNTYGDCTFQSAAISGSFQKDNCPAGGIGSYVGYSLPTGAVTLNSSQADVDSKALAQLNTEGKNNANVYGTCTFYNVAKSGNFTKNNCGSNAVGSYETFTVAAGSYSSSSQEAADNMAQDRVNSYGQIYANEVGRCTFKSVSKSKTLTKNDCAAGGTGSVETFSLPAGAYSSELSQADADQKAQNVVDAVAQTYVNDNGTCTFYSVAKSGSFTRNNCAPGGTPASAWYTVPAGRYSSTDSQAAADAEAQSDVNNNGQAFANNDVNAKCTFWNSAQSGLFTRNNCTVGGSPASVWYNVPAGRYSSTDSQAAADAQAQSEVNNNGQAFANNDVNAKCTFQSAAISGTFQKDNCPAGGVGSYVSYSLPTGAVTLTTSQADVDAKALAQLNTEGRANANAYGFCTFQSAAISGSFQKDNCPVGGIGSYVGYSLPTGAVTLNSSQADVDGKALAQLNAEGKNNANAYGTCTFYNVAKSGNFTKNNCGSNAVGSFETFTVAAGSYSASSQEAADNLAQDRVNSYGQIYANEVGRCTFKSAAKSKTLTKNDCAWGGTGSVGTFSLPAGAYSSELSQADADQKAQNVVDAVAQTYVNDNGTCTFYSVAKSGSFTKNDCAAGTTTTAVVYNVPAGTYTSTGSQAAADNQAQDDVNNNGQAYANANGVCTQAAVYSYDFTYSSGSNSMSIAMRCSVANHPAVTFNFIIYYTSKTNNPSFLRKSFVLPANQTVKNEPFTLSAIAGSISLELTGPVQ